MGAARRQSIVLPPPVGTILLYAADGLAAQQGNLTPAGKPRTPNRDQWVPMFRELVDSEQGLSTLHDLAQAGMRAWNCPPGMIACLDDAFCDIIFRTLSIVALEEFAETANPKIVMPVRQSPSQSPEHQRRSETPPGPKPHLAPHRPRPNPKGTPPTPH